MVLAYALRDKVLRAFGIAVFVAVAGKLLFYDLRAAESVERILSFIVGGVMLVLSAVVDKHFSKRMEVPSVAAKKE